MEPPSESLRDTLAPGLIVAMPQLADPNFHRSVVLLLRHGDSGAFGIVINRPGNLSVGELCATQDIPYAGPIDRPIMIGGPVELDRHLLVLHGEEPRLDLRDEDNDPVEIPVANGVYIVTSRAGLERLANSGDARYRCYVGYAGWGPGQLESELALGAWVPLVLQPDLMFDEPSETVWELALRRGGIDPVTLVPGGEIN